MSSMECDPDARAARRQARAVADALLLVYAMLRGIAGPLPQWPAYHDFAGTRTLG